MPPNLWLEVWWGPITTTGLPQTQSIQPRHPEWSPCQCLTLQDGLMKLLEGNLPNSQEIPKQIEAEPRTVTNVAHTHLDAVTSVPATQATKPQKANTKRCAIIAPFQSVTPTNLTEDSHKLSNLHMKTAAKLLENLTQKVMGGHLWLSKCLGLYAASHQKVKQRCIPRIEL